MNLQWFLSLFFCAKISKFPFFFYFRKVSLLHEFSRKIQIPRQKIEVKVSDHFNYKSKGVGLAWSS